MTHDPHAPRLLVVGCGFPQLGLLRFARAQGLHVIGADANPDAVGVPVCHEFVRASTGSAPEVVEAARSRGAQAITSCGSELALTTMVAAAHELGLRCYTDPERLLRCQYKDLMREAYRAGGAPTPRFVVIHAASAAAAAAREVGLPLVVKPARGWGQRGVSVVERAEELEPAAVRALGAAAAAGAKPIALVEEFAPGEEFSVDAFTTRGETQVLAVTHRIITHYPDPPGITFAEVHPSGLAQGEEAKVIAAAVAGLRALGVELGPSYTQVRSVARGAFLVETAHRMGGGLDPEAAFLASGVSLYRRLLGVALGREDWLTAGPEAPRHGGAIGRFLIGVPGPVRAISGLEEARRQPGVVDAQVYVRVGEQVHPLTDGSKRVGHVLATGGDRAEAEANAERAAALISIDTGASA